MNNRLENLVDILRDAHASVATWSPGDGVTRYRIMAVPEDSEKFGSSVGTYLGYKQALVAARVYREAWHNGANHAHGEAFKNEDY